MTKALKTSSFKRGVNGTVVIIGSNRRHRSAFKGSGIEAVSVGRTGVPDERFEVLAADCLFVTAEEARRIADAHGAFLLMIVPEGSLLGAELADDFIAAPAKPRELLLRASRLIFAARGGSVRGFEPVRSPEQPGVNNVVGCSNDDSHGGEIVKEASGSTFTVVVPNEVVSAGNVVLCRREHTCKKDGRNIVLTPLEFEVLYYLCEHKGITVSSKELYENIWKAQYLDSASSIMPHISRIRSKLGDDPRHPAFLKTVWGVGYKID